MKKVLSYILISLIISANLFAPFSVGWGKNKVEMGKNEAEAADNLTKITLNSTTDHSIGVDGVFSSTEKLDSIRAAYYIGAVANNLSLIDTKDSGSITTDTTGTSPVYNYWFGETISAFFDNGATKSTNLIKGNAYFIKVRIIKKLADGSETFVVGADSDVLSSVVGTPSTTGFAITDEAKAAAQVAYDNAIAGGATKEEAQQIVLGKVYDKKTDVSPKSMPPCNIPFGGGTFTGCIAQGFYYVLFVPSSYLFALAGTMFDYTFSYSVQDSSYRSAFVVQGWGLVRDFCNLFFIFIMLYIAIGTILNLSSVKTKETIINVVIIGLFINFSLFATQLIIDASNITARVFYNSNAIKITEKGVTGATNVVAKVGDGGVIPLSAALVNKINPQNLIIHSDNISDIQDKGGKSEPGGLDAASFILITLVTSAINIVGFTVFITVAFLFIARVIGLWLAMIMAPLAFFTYILPVMSEIKMIGWKHWWPDTLKMAFLAPVFIFFMYLILKFLEADLIADAINKTGLDWFVATIIPFVFIMIFMMKAKKIAVEMSGEFSEMVTKAGSAVGGMALGGAVGLGATAMRATVGRAGSALANSEWASTHGAIGRRLGDLGKWTGTKTFDARNTKLGGMATKDLKVDMGKAKEGGFTKLRADKTLARQKRAKELEVHEDEPLKQSLNKTEIDLQGLLSANKAEIDSLDKTIEIKRQALVDVNAQFGGGSNESKAAGLELQNAKDKKKALRDGVDYLGDKDAFGATTGANAKDYTNIVGQGTYTYVDNAGVTQTITRTITNMETIELKNKKKDIEDENRERKTKYANAVASKTNKVQNFLSSGGQHSSNGANEARHKIIMDTKIESTPSH